MFVVSTPQFQSLLGENYLNRAGLKLIDLGAGDGATTRKMAPFFESVFATEISKPMKWILDKAGYTVLGLDEWQEQKYDVIACLNLLDRCDTPLLLLDQIKSALLPNGRVLVALSLPYAPYVESSKFKQEDNNNNNNNFNNNEITLINTHNKFLSCILLK
ncbi:hypothetical protein WDU94_006529 [Cyamophila willieti]